MVWAVTARGRRRAVRRNIRAIVSGRFRETPSEDEIDGWSRKVFSNFCRYLYDFFRHGRITREWLADHADIEGAEHLAEAAERGRGVVALTLHLGSWELGARATAALGYAVSAVALDGKDRRVSRLFGAQRAAGGIDVIDVGKAARDVIRALRRNEVVAFLADFPPTDKGIAVSLFGRSVIISRGPFNIAAKTGAAVVPCVMARLRGGRYRLVYEAPLPFGSESELAETAAQWVEKTIGGHPDQWCIFRDAFSAGAPLCTIDKL